MTVLFIQRVKRGWGATEVREMAPADAGAARAAHVARLQGRRPFRAYKPGEWAYFRAYGTLSDLHAAGMEVSE